MAGLRIALLGGLDISGGEASARASLTRKAQALVAYLALQGDRSQSREKLAELLWGNSAEEQARANLRQALTSIRRALNGDGATFLVADGDQISLSKSEIDLDVARFERLVAEATPDALKQAAALYKGDFLDGFSLKEDSFEVWARAERERLRLLASNALTKLIAHCDEVGDIERCVETAARLLTLDPLREAAHRILMRAYAAQGRQASALKQFETCRDILRRELGVEPEPETVALYHELRQQRAAAPEGETDTALEQVAAGPPLPDGPSVAVLPFENASDDPDQSYFADGITENVISGLTRFREILVIGVKSILIVREQAADLREIGRALGVAHIVEGSVRRAGDRVRVTAQLVDAATGQRLWAEHYDRDLDDIFAVQDEITDIIVATLAGQIEHLEMRRAAKKPAGDLVAYDCLLRGRQCLNRYTKDGELEARRYFEKALELDPDYAAACAGLSISFIHEYEATWSEAPDKALDRAYGFAQEAVALDDADSPARYAIASACYYRGQHELAKVHIEKALELNPNDYHNICSKAWLLAFSDRASDAVECSLEAIRLNPLVPDNCLFTIGIAEYVAGNYVEALAAFGKVKGWGLLRPAWIAACYAQLGRDAQARAAAAEVRELAPSDPSVPDEDDKERWHAYWSRLMIFEDPNDQARFLDGLRKAGLPA
ncbi:MAG: BTAD domain-containing putative transcriptional regulator [Alphaproteobacteria bacterium]|nr:BTAD domain-containing putative transcriptional regulator [Alphaproteobacteria bacterium]